ncbi:MAG: ATP-binding protein [Dolichospermum sp.]
MNNIKNPYIIGRPIYETENFFGRETLFNFINDNLENDQKTILLFGQRRIGKSSVLSQISRFIPEDRYFCVIFDLQDKDNLNLLGVLNYLAEKIIESPLVSDHEIPLPLTSITDFFDRFLPKIYGSPRVGNRNLVLLLDEFDAFPQGNKFLELIRNQGNKIFCIPVLGRNIDDTNNLLAHFRDAPKQEIGLLDFEESANLITTPSQSVLKYTSDAITAIWELAAGHPYFTQIICFSVFTQARKNNIWVVDRSEVQNIIAKAIETSEAGLAWVLNALSIREKVLFLAVAKLQESEFESSDLTVMVLEQYGVLRTNRPERAVRKLVEWRFLEEIRNSNSSTYKVTIELVRLWLLNKYSLEELIYENENAHRNPYNVGKPVEPEYFIGRKEELQIVLDQIRNSSHWVFYGSRAMGKTSFLKYLAAPTTWQSASYLLLSNYFFVYHDCNTIDNFTFSNFWKEILDKLKGMEKTDFMRSKISQFLTESDLNKNDVRQILQQIKDQGKFLVLLLDNYDRIFDQNHDNQEILKFIKNLEYLKELGNPLSIIMAASKNLSEIASIDVRDYLLYPSQSLKKFGDLEIVQLWDRMPDLLKNREDLRRTAQEITGGYPALIQMLCFSLYNHHSINGEETVTSTPELLKSDFNNRAEQTLQSIWESLNDRQKILLTLIALYHVGGKIDSINYNTSDIRNILTGSKHRSNLEILKTSGIILLDNVELKNNASVMQEWIIRKIANGDLEEVVEREQIFFGMTRRQLNNFRNGIRFIGENIEIVRNVAGGFSTILDLFV